MDCQSILLAALILSLIKWPLTLGVARHDSNEHHKHSTADTSYFDSDEGDIPVSDIKHDEDDHSEPYDILDYEELISAVPDYAPSISDTPIKRIIYNKTNDAFHSDVENKDNIKILNSEKCGINWLSNYQGLGDYIAGGYTVGFGDFPSYVRLQIKRLDGLTSNCGGTLITRQHVLTAAHCTRKVKSILVQPTIYYDHSDAGPVYNATTICVNEIAGREPLDAMKSFFDISILRLDRPVTLSDRVQIACLPSKPLPPNAEVIAVGLGISDNRDLLSVDVPDQLQALPVRRISCRKHDQHHSNVCFESYMDKYKGDTCVGDSGGPLFMRSGNQQMVAAVTSYGPIECHPGTKGYSVNADVYSMRKIILDGLEACNKYYS